MYVGDITEFSMGIRLFWKQRNKVIKTKVSKGNFSPSIRQKTSLSLLGGIGRLKVCPYWLEYNLY